MYITIMDVTKESVSVINDAENTTANMKNEEILALLYKVGFAQEDHFCYMVTEDSPIVQEPITLEELLEEE